MISFNLSYLPKALSPDTVTWGVGASIYEWGRQGDTIQSIALMNSFFNIFLPLNLSLSHPFSLTRREYWG